MEYNQIILCMNEDIKFFTKFYVLFYTNLYFKTQKIIQCIHCKYYYMEEAVVNLKKLFSLTFIIVSIFTFCIFPFDINAMNNDNRTIRVAYPIQEGLNEVDEQGRYSGYNYEYLQEIAQYTGWNYEFVRVGGDTNTSLLKSMEMLEKGEVDLMGGMLYDEQLEKIYDYAGSSYGTVNTVLQVLKDNVDIDSVSSQVTKTMRIAVPENGINKIKELDRYCEMNQISPELVPCKTGEEQLQALKDGKADAMLNVSMNHIDGVRTIAKFSPKPFYFITYKGNKELSQQLNSAISNIEQTDPYFSQTLYEKYFTPENKELVLSNKESEYIKNIETLQVGVLLKNPPFQYVDDKTGKLKGISIDLLNYISDKTGLKFDMIPVKSQKELDNMIKDSKIDIVAGMSYDYERARERHVAMTRPFISTQYIMMINNKINEDSLENKRLALTKDTSYKEYSSNNIIWYDTLEECIEAVNSGRADYTYGEGYAIQYYVNQPKYKYVRLIQQNYEPHRFCFGVAKQNKQELYSILNKAINSMPTENMQSIIYKNTTYISNFSLIHIMQENPIQTILIVSSISLCIIIIMAWSLRIRTSMNQRISLELKKHTEVYEMASEYFFEYDYQADKITIAMQENGVNVFNGLSHSKDEYENEIEKEYREQFFKLIREQENGSTEMYCVCPDGEFHWVRITSKIIHNEKNVPVYSIGKLHNIDCEKEEKMRLLDKAQRDSLTNIFNAASIRDMATKSLDDLSHNERGALLILDIDYFKDINDTYGHLVGDKMLIAVANILVKCFDECDIVGRLGGDEFSIYVKNVKDTESLIEKCNILYDKIHGIKLPNGNSISVSMGGVISKQGQTYDEIYKMADDALYNSKKQGRNRFKITE